MRRVSFKVAKIIKAAGYPQWSVEEADNSKFAYDCEGELWEIRYFDQNPQDYYTAPYAMDVWLWLWREKDIKIDLDYYTQSSTIYINDNGKKGFSFSDPEEAIIAAIDHLVTNDLKK